MCRICHVALLLDDALLYYINIVSALIGDVVRLFLLISATRPRPYVAETSTNVTCRLGPAFFTGVSLSVYMLNRTDVTKAASEARINDSCLHGPCPDSHSHCCADECRSCPSDKLDVNA